MSLGPFIRSPFTDLTGCLINHQSGSRCAGMEMRMVECLEAYGVERGRSKCKLLIEDFQECSGRKKQILRTQAMRLERHRQYLLGEKETHYEPAPRVDAF